VAKGADEEDISSNVQHKLSDFQQENRNTEIAYS
jgi:hypothetical protein